ncbi:hypothetical protein [Natronorubrum sp. DTA7]|uniref:hypothetical protein n=1 Tax=Natronorubrum sp. DTA7 TaxID=3447016 RepID=UPI003F87D680
MASQSSRSLHVRLGGTLAVVALVAIGIVALVARVLYTAVTAIGPNVAASTPVVAGTLVLAAALFALAYVR